MSLKAEIETWATALELYDSQNFDEALATFEDIADSSKILFNIGLIYATLGEHEVAIENFKTAISLDQYLAVAYFQCGVSNFLLGMYEEAVKDFEDALLYLRGNLTIDYAQLGLKFRLYSCEVLFNKGLSLIYMGAEADGMIDLEEARKEKQTSEHSVIDDAIADRADGYTVFSIPVGVLYRPAQSKLKNLASKNYLGQAKLVAATDSSETFVGFTGSARAAAKTSSGLPSSGGPMAEFAAGSSIQRRGTTAARIEGTVVARSNAANELRRRPSDNTASVTPRLTRTATSSSGLSRPSKLSTMQERRESDADRQRYGGSPRGGGRGGAGSAVGDSQDGGEGDRINSWARSQSIAGSSSSNGRSRGPSIRKPSNMPGSPYDDGSGSGAEYPETLMSYAPMTKVRVKLHHGSDTRGMAVASDMGFDDFVLKVAKKFSLNPERVAMKYKDEEATMISILDEDDWESAVETARAYAKGRAEGKVEIWVED